MKLLLLTLCPQMNYGGVLQAYATQEKLRQLGHEVLLFDGLEWAAPDAYYLGRRPVPGAGEPSPFFIEVFTRGRDCYGSGERGLPTS